jgi:hypothetical protein
MSVWRSRPRPRPLPLDYCDFPYSALASSESVSRYCQNYCPDVSQFPLEERCTDVSASDEALADVKADQTEFNLEATAEYQPLIESLLKETR